jgi:hypothetical protein
MSGAESAHANAGSFDLLRRATQAMMSKYVADLLPLLPAESCPGPALPLVLLLLCVLFDYCHGMNRIRAQAVFIFFMAPSIPRRLTCALHPAPLGGDLI